MHAAGKIAARAVVVFVGLEICLRESAVGLDELAAKVGARRARDPPALAGRHDVFQSLAEGLLHAVGKARPARAQKRCGGRPVGHTHPGLVGKFILQGDTAQRMIVVDQDVGVAKGRENILGNFRVLIVLGIRLGPDHGDLGPGVPRHVLDGGHHGRIDPGLVDNGDHAAFADLRAIDHAVLGPAYQIHRRHK